MDGLKPITLSSKDKGLLKPRLCPNCPESNIPESKFCSKCKFVLTYDAYDEKIGEAERTKKELTTLEQKTTTLQTTVEEMQKRFNQLIEDGQRKAILHEIKMRELKGESNPQQLTDQEIKDILYEDYLEDFQPQAEGFFRLKKQQKHK